MSSFHRNCLNTGSRLPKCCSVLRFTTKRENRFRKNLSTRSNVRRRSIRDLHLAGDRKIDPDAFERETLAQLGMPKEIVMRHRTPQFLHIFSSDSYSAGYYSYLWSDVLTADAFGAFVEGKGPYDKAVAERLRKYVFSVGNTIDPAEGYRG